MKLIETTGVTHEAQKKKQSSHRTSRGHEGLLLFMRLIMPPNKPTCYTHTHTHINLDTHTQAEKEEA